MARLSLLLVLVVLWYCSVAADDIYVKPGTYNDIPANPGDNVIFSPGVYILPENFKLVTHVMYLGNQSIITGSQSWEGTSNVIISGFIFQEGTIINFENNDTLITIRGNTFYSSVNSSSSAIINTFGSTIVDIFNNTFYGLNEQQLAISIAQSADVVILQNSFIATSVEFQIYSTEYGVNMYNTGVYVYLNCFWNVSGNALLIFVGIAGPNFETYIVGNTIYNYHSKLPDFTRAINIQLIDQQFNVTGNYLSPAEASGAICNFCTPIVIQTTYVSKNGTISSNTICGNAWSYYVQCFTEGDQTIPVHDNWFYGNVTPPVSTPCGKLPNTIRPRSDVPPPPICWNELC